MRRSHEQASPLYTYVPDRAKRAVNPEITLQNPQNPTPISGSEEAATRAERHAGARRTLDLVASAAGLVVLAPVLAALALAVKLGDGGPALYVSRRVGRYGRPLSLYKFRTMVVGADRQGPGITTAADRRVTRVGAVLRRYKLDELPQLANVLKGEMSLVGPRPEDPRYVAAYTPEERRVLDVRPGLTSPASLAFRDEARRLEGEDWERVYVEEILPAKLALERAYLRRRTLGSDLGLILRTLGRLFRPRDA